MVEKYNIFILCMLLCTSFGCTHPFDEQKDNTPLNNFEALWNIIDKKYCLFDDKNIDWKEVYSSYSQRFDTMKIVEYEDNYRWLR